MKKTVIRIIIIAIVVLAVAIISCYVLISANASGKTYDIVKSIPGNDVGLLLGTSPVNNEGSINRYFQQRIIAASELYKGGKIRRIIASGGDYSKRKGGWNELEAMHDSLVSHGVPDSVILLDYNGQRTISSILNAINVYGLDTLTLISQEYHNQRAIWLSEHYGLHVIAYNAKTPDLTNKKIRNISREFLARVKMFLDLATSNEQN